jgi:hypothetical protein
MSGPDVKKINDDALGDTESAATPDIAGGDAQVVSLRADVAPATLGTRMTEAVAVGDEEGGAVIVEDDMDPDTNPGVLVHTLTEASRVAEKRGGRLTMDRRKGKDGEFIMREGQEAGKGTIIGIVGDETTRPEPEDNPFAEPAQPATPQRGGLFAAAKRWLWGDE